MYKLVSPVSLLSPTRVYLVMSLMNDGTSIPFIVVVDSLNVFGAVSVLARFTIVYFTLSITTSIGFLSSTFTFNIYVLTLPFCAVNFISNLFSHSLTSTYPKPVIEAVLSSTEAVSVTFNTSLGTDTEYSSLSEENSSLRV